MKRLFKLQANNYTLYGALFGLLFPIFSTLFQAWFVYRNFHFSSIINIQKSSILLWVINTAPFWLGIFLRIAGIKQDQLNRQINELKKSNTKIIYEMTKSKIAENEIKEKNKIITEGMIAAKKVQEFFLPELPKDPIIDIDYRYIPMESVGGDFLQLIRTKNGKITFFIGDVAGHGIAAALITPLSIALLNKLNSKYGNTPQTYLEKFNNEIINYLPDPLYLSAIYGLLTHEKNEYTLTFCRSGHPYPVIWHAKEKYARKIKSEGGVIGYTNNYELQEKTIKLAKGDFLFFYTDGITESYNTNKEELGITGLIKIIENTCIHDYPLKKTIDIILNKIDDFCVEKRNDDDKLLLGFKIK